MGTAVTPQVTVLRRPGAIPITTRPARARHVGSRNLVIIELAASGDDTLIGVRAADLTALADGLAFLHRSLQQAVRTLGSGGVIVLLSDAPAEHPTVAACTASIWSAAAAAAAEAAADDLRRTGTTVLHFTLPPKQDQHDRDRAHTAMTGLIDLLSHPAACALTGQSLRVDFGAGACLYATPNPATVPE